MPAPPWATPEQLEFLTSRIPDFQAAQREKLTADFWPIVTHDFFARWPTQESETASIPTVPKSKRGKKKKSIETSAQPQPMTHAKWTNVRSDQIVNWFNNRGIGSTHRRGGTTIVIGAPPGRAHSAKELYSKENYTEKIQPRVAQIVKQENIGTKQRLSVIAKCTAEAWDAETPEVRKYYEDKSAQQKKDTAQKSDDTLEKRSDDDYAEGLVGLPEALKGFGIEIKKRTNWNITVLAGGWDPKQQKLRTMAYHHGRDRRGQMFSVAYPHFYENVLSPFRNFLENVEFNANDPETGANDIQTENNSTNTSTMLPGDSLDTHVGTTKVNMGPGPGIPTAAHFAGAIPTSSVNDMPIAGCATHVHPLPGMESSSVWFNPADKYDMPAGWLPTLDQMDIDNFGITGSSWEELLRSAKSDWNTPTNPTQPLTFNFVDEDIPSMTASKIQQAPESTTSKPEPVIVQVGAFQLPVAVNTASGDVESAVPVTVGGIQSATTPNAASYDVQVTPAITVGGSQSAPAMSTTPAPPMTVSGTQASAAPGAAAADVQTTPAITVGGSQSAHAVNTTSAGDAQSAPPTTAQVSNMGRIETIPPIPVGQSENSGSSLTTTEGSATDKTNVSHDDDDGKRVSRKRKPAPSKEIPIQLGWLDLTHEYLTRDIPNKKWQELIVCWHGFELKEASYASSVPIGKKRCGRPKELGKWLQTRKYGTIPKLIDVDEFADDWHSWWNQLQPKWRQSSVPTTLPLPIDIHAEKDVDGDDIALLRRGGPSGLVTVLIGLKWWAHCSKPARWEEAIDDVQSCLKAFENMGGAKRKSLAEEVNAKKKTKLG